MATQGAIFICLSVIVGPIRFGCGSDAQVADRKKTTTDGAHLKKSIEEKTRVHRLSNTKRTTYDAFVYVNRIPSSAEQDESASDLSGRIFGRLANQEGRILLKVPPGMTRKSYRGFKTFLRYSGATKVGNCAAYHTPIEFTDLKSHVVTQGGNPLPTPSLRNLKKRNINIRQAILGKITASKKKRSGAANEIDVAYNKINLKKDDVDELVAFLELLDDVSDQEFRKLILKAQSLDTSEETIEGGQLR